MTNLFISLLNTIPFPAIIIDDAGIIMHLNQLVEQFLDATPEKFIGLPINQVLPDIPDLAGTALSRKFQFIHGSEKWFQGNIAPFADGFAGFLITFDVVQDDPQKNAELKKTVDELKEKLANQEVKNAKIGASRDILLASLSHKLRTPLNAIIGYSEMLQEESNDLGLNGITADLAQIKTAAISLLEVIRRVLDFSKLESGTIIFTKTTADATKLITSVTQDIKLKKNILKTTSLSDLGTFYTDPERFYDAISLFLLGLDKHTNDGSIHLKADRVSETNNKLSENLEIKIKATGQTLNPTRFQEMIDPFGNQAGSENKHNVADLELAIGYLLVLQMGGKINVHTDQNNHINLRITYPIK